MNPYRALKGQYINGIWRDGASQKVLADKNPFTGETLAEFKLATRADLDEAYGSAQRAQGEWAQVNPYQKRTILERAIQYVEDNERDITDIIMDELGGTRLKAFFEISLVKDIIKEAATYPLRMTGEIFPSPVEGKENRLYRVPVGVVGVISPFNFPFFLSMRSVAPALGAGNGVVLKPHEETPITGGTLAGKMFEAAGIPRGLLNVIVTEISEIGDAFIEHPIPSVISFTGSDAVGRHIGGIAGRNLKRAILELGGNSALIVLEDADLNQAVNASVFSRFTHQGQICMSANRILVHRSIYAKFLEQYAARVSKLKVGNPRDEDTVIGPLINKKQADALSKQIDEGVRQGARPVLRGRIEGNLAAPTILADVTPAMSVAREELFGPAVCVMPFDSVEEAIEIANNSRFGLSGAIHTRDVEYGAELAKKMRTGMVHVNDGTINDEPIIAFGGEKDSGYGRLNGRWALEEFTTLRWVSVQHKPRQFPY